MRILAAAMLAASLLSVGGTARAYSGADAPGHDRAPVCEKEHCEGDHSAHNVQILLNSGDGQGGRLAPGGAREVSFKLPDGDYRCLRVQNVCSEDAFISLDKSDAWLSFVNNTSACLVKSSCGYYETWGPWSAWSATCGPAARDRWIGCTRCDGRPVDQSLCWRRQHQIQYACFACTLYRNCLTDPLTGVKNCEAYNPCDEASVPYNATCPDGAPPTASGQCPQEMPQTCLDGTPKPLGGACAQPAPTLDSCRNTLVRTCPSGAPMPASGICTDTSPAPCPDGSTRRPDGTCPSCTNIWQSQGVVVADYLSDNRWRVGTPGDNYWGGHCAVYDEVMEVQAESDNAFETFKLVWVGWDDYTMMTVESADNTVHHVFSGPDGGDRLEVHMLSEVDAVWRALLEGQANGTIPIPQVCYTSGCGGEGGSCEEVCYDDPYIDFPIVVTSSSRTGGCERSTSWQANVEIDLRPFLKRGTNRLRMHTVVTGGGESWFDIIAVPRTGTICR